MITINVDGVVSVAVERQLLISLLRDKISLIKANVDRYTYTEDGFKEQAAKIEMYTEMLKNIKATI